MELTLMIAVIGCVLSVFSFFLARKDKSNQDVENSSYNAGRIDAILDNINKKLDKIEKKLDVYDKEIDERVENAINNHIRIYHKGVK